MIQTFRDAGYRVVSAYDEGVLQLEFPIEPTDTAIGIMQGREHVAEAASIDRFFNPHSVAVIGASRRQDTIGQALVRNLVTGDYTGRVYAVNPSASAVSGLPAYKNVMFGPHHPRQSGSSCQPGYPKLAEPDDSSAPTPGSCRRSKASSMPLLPPGSPVSSCHHRVLNIHSCSRSPA